MLVKNYSLKPLTGIVVNDPLAGATPSFGTFVAGGAAAVLTLGQYTINMMHCLVRDGDRERGLRRQHHAETRGYQFARGCRELHVQLHDSLAADFHRPAPGILEPGERQRHGPVLRSNAE